MKTEVPWGRMRKDDVSGDKARLPRWDFLNLFTIAQRRIAGLLACMPLRGVSMNEVSANASSGKGERGREVEVDKNMHLC
jgi:hypothetical protein